MCRCRVACLCVDGGDCLYVHVEQPLVIVHPLHARQSVDLQQWVWVGWYVSNMH